jgi:hypothetical protein
MSNENINPEDQKTSTETKQDECLDYIFGHQKIMLETQEFKHNELEIKESKLKNGGLGLFTNVFIPINNIICFYPCDLVQNMKNPNIFYKEGKIIQMELNEINKKLVYMNDYSINMDHYRIIPDIEQTNKVYCGHMANDRGYHPLKTYKKELNNCRFEALNIVSNKDIQKGEELCVSYGSNYWYNINSAKNISRHDEIKNNLK